MVVNIVIDNEYFSMSHNKRRGYTYFIISYLGSS